MRLHIGSDHAGLELKNELLAHLVNNGHDVTDHGPYEYDALDDYPDFCIPAAQAVAKDATSLKAGLTAHVTAEVDQVGGKRGPGMGGKDDKRGRGHGGPGHGGPGKGGMGAAPKIPAPSASPSA